MSARLAGDNRESSSPVKSRPKEHMRLDPIRTGLVMSSMLEVAQPEQTSIVAKGVHGDSSRLSCHEVIVSDRRHLFTNDPRFCIVTGFDLRFNSLKGGERTSRGPCPPAERPTPLLTQGQPPP